MLLGDFNTDLLNFDTSDHIKTILDSLQLLLPTRVCINSKTLINNIFCNITKPLAKSASSGNISSSISYHLPQFFILPDFFSNSIPTRYNMSHDWENLTSNYFLRILKRQIGIKFSN